MTNQITKHIKVFIFQKKYRDENNSFVINNCNLDIMQEYTYLGTKITPTSSFASPKQALSNKVLQEIWGVYENWTNGTNIIKQRRSTHKVLQNLSGRKPKSI